MSTGPAFEDKEGRQPKDEETNVEPVGQFEHALPPNEYLLAAHD